MLSDIFCTMRTYHMIEPGMRVIAGVSGGADSVCLLDVLKKYQEEVPFELLVVHVEHGLRGQESLEDAAFVEELCAAGQIPCRVAHAEVRRRAAEEGLSCEEAGRAERYRIFEEICEEWGAARIAVAHNQNDQAETVLWNLSRGSGLRGLGGIRPVQGKVIRPLLFTSRTEIETYLRKAGRNWRTDRTNLETDYTRNRIRLSILPQMEEGLNPQAGRHIAEAAGRLREVQEYLDKKTDEAAERCFLKPVLLHDEVIIRLSFYKNEDPLIRRELLRRALQMCGGLKDVGTVHLEKLDALTGMDCGKSLDLPGEIWAVREDGILRIAHRRPEKERLMQAIPLAIPGCVETGGVCVRAEILSKDDFDPDMISDFGQLKKYFLTEKKYTKWFSYDTIETSLQLRTRRTGDYLVIDAHGGKKKLKDYFIDQKIPRTLRDQILLLADGSHILWVIGWRISEAAKVTGDTRQILKVQVSEEEKTHAGKSENPAFGAGSGSADC